MTEHELTSLPGCVASYWNANNPSTDNHGTTQGSVLDISDRIYGKLTVSANLRFVEDAKDCDEIQSVVEPEYSWRNCTRVVSRRLNTRSMANQDGIQ